MSYAAPPPILHLAWLLLFPPLLLTTAQSQLTNTATISGKPYSTYYFPDFDSITNGTGLVLFKDAAYSRSAIQLTPDTYSVQDYVVNTSGRAFFTKPFKLWEARPSASHPNATYVASFNTSFNINIVRVNGIPPGEGVAFLIASSPDVPPPGSHGGYLGLTNSTLDGNPNNQFVAVELDTVKEDFDPNDNHVGLDVNSVRSIATRNLSFLISPVTATHYTVWVDYDGVTRHIWVYMAVEGSRKPSSPVLNSSLDLSANLSSKSYFGFSGSTGTQYEFNCLLSWNLMVETLPDEKKSRMTSWKLGVVVASSVLAVLALFTGFLVSRRRKVRDDPNSALVVGTLKTLPGMPKEFDFKDLMRATNNFDEKTRLGKGGFGEVYKGLLPGENKEVAVKKFSRDDGRHDDFLKELTIINRLRHRHLVSLLGWCHTNGMLLLVYDYMPNGSLDQHLFHADKPILSWERRYNVIAGVASALHYLHDEFEQWVVHRDLKASNIMLDASFNARLGDFGLARAVDTDKTSYTEVDLGGVPGTVGYIAPECFHTGRATRKTDVYGLGAVVLEVVCGRRPRCDIGHFKFLTDWVWSLHRKGRILEAVDPRLEGNYDMEDAQRLLLLGLACSHPIPGKRPKMPAVVQIVSRAVAPPEVPHQKPAFLWPYAGGDEEDDIWPEGLVEEEDDEWPSNRLTSTTTASAMTSASYVSSVEWSPHFLSRDGHTGPGDSSVSRV